MAARSLRHPGACKRDGRQKLVLLVNGSHKADILRRIVSGPVESGVPASILMLHPDLLIIADREAAALLP